MIAVSIEDDTRSLDVSFSPLFAAKPRVPSPIVWMITSQLTEQ